MKTRIGIIGVGTISTVIVKGFCGSGADCEIVLSPRNPDKAAALAAEFGNVTVAGSNQEVLDRSEWVIIAVVPRIWKEVCGELSFRKDHCVVNLMTDYKLTEIASMIGETKVLVRMIPLPFIAYRTGPVVIYPTDAATARLFAPLGETIEVGMEKALESMSVTTALMSSFYKLMHGVISWGVDEGLTAEEARQYSASFFEALLFMIKRSDAEGVEKLANEMTPGGLNEMALKHIGEANGFRLWTEALTKVMKRVQKTE